LRPPKIFFVEPFASALERKVPLLPQQKSYDSAVLPDSGVHRCSVLQIQIQRKIKPNSGETLIAVPLSVLPKNSRI
jgi:hypothetical protein